MYIYESNCTDVYKSKTAPGGFETAAAACKNCKSSQKFTSDFIKVGPCGSIVEHFQVFGKDSKNNSSVKIIIIISVIAILCVLGFLGYRHMNKKK